MTSSDRPPGVQEGITAKRRKKHKKKSRHWFKRWESAFGLQIRKVPLGNQPTVCFLLSLLCLFAAIPFLPADTPLRPFPLSPILPFAMLLPYDDPSRCN